MLKRSMAVAAFSTAFAIGLVSPVFAANQDFVSTLANTNANTSAIPYQPDLKLAQVSSAINLTGKWRGDDGFTYYVRQVGNQVWWYGEPNPTNPCCTNVFKGIIQDNLLSGNWADVPKGSILSNGDMVIQITSPNRLETVYKTGGFGGSVWTR